MVALVRIALRRPYTFVVLALLILITGSLAALRTPIDIFPEIRIPIIAAIWQYTGLSPDQMAGRMVSQYQRVLTTTVNDIEHVEATSYNGLGIVKVFFQPGADIRIANAQVTSSTTTRRPFRSFNSRWPARVCRNSDWQTLASTSSAPRSSQCLGPPYPIPTAASRDKFRSTSTRPRCRRAVFPARTWPTRLLHRI